MLHTLGCTFLYGGRKSLAREGLFQHLTHLEQDAVYPVCVLHWNFQLPYLNGSFQRASVATQKRSKGSEDQFTADERACVLSEHQTSREFVIYHAE